MRLLRFAFQSTRSAQGDSIGDVGGEGRVPEAIRNVEIGLVGSRIRPDAELPVISLGSIQVPSLHISLFGRQGTPEMSEVLKGDGHF